MAKQAIDRDKKATDNIFYSKASSSQRPLNGEQRGGNTRGRDKDRKLVISWFLITGSLSM